ncbi:hypothetical protein RHMOL_Rhmol09G0211400 [Rhododendron molle]|uniref:Uncharacterized protein n=1 Tax=Rhododendron molle TaxID=49168 RepID=A0ACC0MG43_RHOML|nr:hypothetical protein RHMOL_Rhmol09G0211400 [Rhododendron molle]
MLKSLYFIFSRSASNIGNHHLSNIIFDYRYLIWRFDNINTKHIFKEDQGVNMCADALANDTPISVGDLYFYTYIPSCISNLLLADYPRISYPRHVLF